MAVLLFFVLFTVTKAHDKCTDIWDPHCCDGIDYRNPCTAASAGIYYPQYSCDPGECPPDQDLPHSRSSSHDSDESGSCECVSTVTPVCCDYRQYDNLCIALCNGEEEEECILDSCANAIIDHLNLVPLTNEGGYYRETYRSEQLIDINGKSKSSGTAIYYMITNDTSSVLHRLSIDEIWHFYMGDPIEMLLIYSNGTSTISTIGNDIFNGETLQQFIPTGTWQGSQLKYSEKGYCLLATTTAPGFDFDDFELGDRDELIQQYPQISDLITKYT